MNETSPAAERSEALSLVGQLAFALVVIGLDAWCGTFPRETLRNVVVREKKEVDVAYRGIDDNYNFRQLAISIEGRDCLRCPSPLCEELSVGDRLATLNIKSCHSDPCACVVDYVRAQKGSAAEHPDYSLKIASDTP